MVACSYIFWPFLLREGTGNVRRWNRDISISRKRIEYFKQMFQFTEPMTLINISIVEKKNCSTHISFRLSALTREYVRDSGKKSSNFHHQLSKLKPIIKIVYKNWLHDTKVALSLSLSWCGQLQTHTPRISRWWCRSILSWSRKLFR